MAALRGSRGSTKRVRGLRKTSCEFLPLANFRSLPAPQTVSSPYLPGNIRNVSAIHTSAILQSTKLLHASFVASTSLKCGEPPRSFFVAESELLQAVQEQIVIESKRKAAEINRSIWQDTKGCCRSSLSGFTNLTY